MLQSRFFHRRDNHGSEERLRKIESAVKNSFGEEIAGRVIYFLPDGFAAFLEKLPSKPSPPTEEKRRGYKVKKNFVTLTDAERKARDEEALKLMTEEMKKRRKK